MENVNKQKFYNSNSNLYSNTSMCVYHKISLQKKTWVRYGAVDEVVLFTM